jgi:hypothetical protein
MLLQQHNINCTNCIASEAMHFPWVARLYFNEPRRQRNIKVLLESKPLSNDVIQPSVSAAVCMALCITT